MYRLQLISRSPVLIGGHDSSVEFDTITAHREKGQVPYIPGAAIKGAMRIDFERLMRALEERVCGAPDPKAMNDCARHPCIACRLFGAPGNRPGTLRFSDGRASIGAFIKDAYVERTAVSISRRLKKAEPGKLFNFAAAPPGLVFAAEIDELGPLESQDKQKFESALSWWKAEGLRIGGGKSRGLGFFEVSATEPVTPVAFPTWRPLSKRTVFGVRMSAATARECEPIRVGTIPHREWFLGNLGFVPGSTARGALGWGLREVGASENLVADVMADGSCLFTHLYGVAPEHLRPATAVQCKLDEKHPLQDTLLLQYALKNALANRNDDALANLYLRLTTCPMVGCGGRLKPAPFQPAAPRRLHVKLGLDRATGKAADGLFYVYDCTEPAYGAELHGYLVGDEALTDLVGDGGLSLRIGGARSKGYGAVTLRLSGASEIGDPEAVSARRSGLQEAAEKLLSDAHLPPLDRRLFSLTLITDLCPQPGGSVQALLLDVLDLPDCRVETAAAVWTWLGGYKQQLGQRRTLSQVIQRGAAFLFSVPVETQERELDESLARIETGGLGALRENGFGWVCACHRHHSFSAPGMGGVI